MRKRYIYVILIVILLITSCGRNNNNSKVADTVIVTENDTVNAENKNVIKYRFVEPTKRDGNDFFYDNYSLIDLKNGKPCSIKIDNKVYQTDNAILDFGELQLLLYEDGNDKVTFVGLIDYYSSVFFIYYVSTDGLHKLGIIDSDQPNVEEEGFKETTFDVYKKEDVIEIHVYLGEKETQVQRFKIESL
jgi:hypothetical protein